MSQKSGKHKLTDGLGLPPEILSETPVVCLRGKECVSIENHRGILAYAEDRVIVSVKRGCISVTGGHLTIACMTKKFLQLRGSISAIEME